MDAFAELYDAMAARVYGLIQRLVRDPAKSEEITQEVMLTLWRTAARYDPAQGSVSTWTLTIAHRRAVEQARADQLRRLLNRIADQGDDNRGQQLVKRCLAGLPHLQREAIMLAYYQGYTHSQVADILDADLSAIKSGIRAGLLRRHTGLEQTRNSHDHHHHQPPDAGRDPVNFHRIPLAGRRGGNPVR